ncbi:hypothetical protein KI387_019368, partial [Taxus chinensis]
GTVRLIFQPAEEGGAGAHNMTEEGALADAEAIFGMHVDPTSRVGIISSRAGPYYAASGRFDAIIDGKGGHAAFPDMSVDPVVCSCFIVLSLQQLISRETDPLDSRVISIGYIQGGNATNVILSQVKIGGSLRSLTSAGLTILQDRVREVIESQVFVHKCNGSVVFGERPYPAVENDENLHNQVKNVGATLLGSNNVKTANKVMASEDFSFYQQKIPGLMLAIGVRGENEPIISIHSPFFTLDEAILPIGAALHTAIAEMYFDKDKENGAAPETERHTGL